ncbi:MAG: penicillin-binding transpeptidase domain-containing protein, partial [Clostridia bacterium]
MSYVPKKKNSKKRVIAIIVLIVVTFGLLISRLVYLQIVSGEEMLNKSQNRILKNNVINAPRGEIRDRNGIPLVTSQEGYSILIDKGDAIDDDFNKSLLKLYNYFVEEKTPFRDTFPITLCPFTFTQNKEDLQNNKEFSDFIKSKANIKNFTADNVMDSLIKIYDLKEYELDDARVIIGIRYEIEKTLKSTGLMYEFASDIPITIITKIKENQADLKGIYIEPIFKRKYTYDNFAGHILGRTGKISKSEFDELQNKGYQYNDLIGKDGIESVFEEYLKGSDGIKQIARDMNGRIIKTLNKKEPSSGSNVTLTIDKELQATAESSLKGHIEDLKATFKEGSIGSDIKGASIVVMDVNSGEVLSLANYPTVNLVDYNSNYESYRNDTLSPLINRAISSAYPCGSSFKMLTGIAALETNSINKDFSYNCSGRYKYFSDYQPTCFRNTAHGTVTIEKALKSSCNGFFFEAGRLTGISKLDEYAKMFGFGDRSGIE